MKHTRIFLTDLGPFMTLDLANLMGPGTRRWMEGTEPDSATLIFMLLDELCDHGIESAQIRACATTQESVRRVKFATMHRDSHLFIFKFMCEKIRKDANACNAPPGFQWERGRAARCMPTRGSSPPTSSPTSTCSSGNRSAWKPSALSLDESEHVLDAFNEDIIPDAGGVDVMKHGGICDSVRWRPQRCGRCNRSGHCNRKCLVAAYKTHKRAAVPSLMPGTPGGVS